MVKTPLPALRGKMKISRRLNNRTALGVRKHARHAGEIIWCWNILNEHLFGIWAALLSDVHIKKTEVANVIWNSIQSDKTQRDMLLSVARVIYPRPKEEGEKASKHSGSIEWLIKSVSELSKFRNDAAHVPVQFSIFKNSTFLFPSGVSGRAQAVDRLTEEPTATVWRKVRGDLIALATYAIYITPHYYNYTTPEGIENERRWPWPHKPRLLSLLKKGSTKSKPRRRQSKKRRPRQPGS